MFILHIDTWLTLPIEIVQSIFQYLPVNEDWLFISYKFDNMFWFIVHNDQFDDFPKPYDRFVNYHSKVKRKFEKLEFFVQWMLCNSKHNKEISLDKNLSAGIESCNRGMKELNSMLKQISEKPVVTLDNYSDWENSFLSDLYDSFFMVNNRNHIGKQIGSINKSLLVEIVDRDVYRNFNESPSLEELVDNALNEESNQIIVCWRPPQKLVLPKIFQLIVLLHPNHCSNIQSTPQEGYQFQFSNFWPVSQYMIQNQNKLVGENESNPFRSVLYCYRDWLSFLFDGNSSSMGNGHLLVHCNIEQPELFGKIISYSATEDGLIDYAATDFFQVIDFIQANGINSCTESICDALNFKN